MSEHWPALPEEERGVLRIVDLFSGCGGMTLGAALAAIERGVRPEVRLASETEEIPRNIYSKNLGQFTLTNNRGGANERIVGTPVQELFDGRLDGRVITATERRTKWLVGPIDLLVAGPPCQGHSNLNNYTRRNDPRNDLYTRVARAAAVLRPTVVIIENVGAIVHDCRGVLESTRELLLSQGYQVGGGVQLRLRSLGVPQDRRRHFLIAGLASQVDPLAIERRLTEAALAVRTVAWAIRDLECGADPQGSGGFDAPPRPSAENRRRIQWLFENRSYRLPNSERPACHRVDGHRYRSIYGRLTWGAAAQTITTGFGSMGQGCYVHPSRRRTITPHEAARLQTFPDFFSFGATNKRRWWARVIGNAVPPYAMKRVVEAVLPALKT